MLRVACQPSLASRLVPRAIKHLSSEHPGVRVSLHVPSPETIWLWASTGQCDIGLVRPRSGYSGVECESSLKSDAVCALPRRHPLAHKRTIGVSDLADVPLIAGGPGVFQHRIEETFARAGTEPRFAFMAQFTTARCGLVAEGLGLAIVDPLAARELSGLPIVLRPFRPRVAIETMLIRPGARPLGQIAARFIDLLKAERDIRQT